MEAETIEEYCRAIDRLDTGGGVRSIELAKRLSRSKNTISLTLDRLSLSGFIIKEPYGKILLTKKGQVVAKRMNFKHRVIESFLFEKLKMDAGTIHKEACRLEHALSDDAAQRLYAFLGKPEKDPHGRDII